MSSKQKELLNCMDEFRNRGINIDEVRQLFQSVAVEEPKQWRSINNIIAHLPDDKLVDLLNRAKAFLENEKKYNDKLIVIYSQLTDEKISAIDIALTNLKENSNELEFGYTFDAYENVFGEQNLKFFKFKKIRSISLKEDINIDDINIELKSELIEFDKIVGIKAKDIICTDSVVIDIENNTLILQLDLVSLLKASDIDRNLDFLESIVNTALFDKFGNENQRLMRQSEVVNLFGCIKNFYENPEGNITKLSFTTSKGVHHEILKGAVNDIRTANYHIGGKAKEGSINPYRVTKKFLQNTKNHPQAAVGVRYQYYASLGTKHLEKARIFDIHNYQSYIYIIKKLLENI